MSINQPRVIDFLSTRDGENLCVATISDHLEWNSGKHLIALQDKLNNYLAFIESGEIYEARPESREQDIEISIRCKYTPEEDDDLRFLQLARDTIQSAGFGFSIIIDDKEFILPITNNQ